MITTGELKKGLTIEMDGELYRILDWQHIKMARGSAQVRMKLRNLRSGSTINHTCQAGSRFGRARLDRAHVQYLYHDADRDLYYFMDTDTFEQFPMNPVDLEGTVDYLKDNLELDVLSYDGEPIEVELPITVDLQVIETEPGFKGDTATGGTKAATVETGLVVQVPLFIEIGDVIRLDTRYGTYNERV
ncbi:MAG: elongation factor P [Chloroflexi bacterium]|nr:elongation factor P [Chloroflexota bacterium]MBU1746065.1 elongation factor P [Chloroflexota bacterium]MBU1879124.1 elongation factor P [Chloroflexota bacterium]